MIRSLSAALAVLPLLTDARLPAQAGEDDAGPADEVKVLMEELPLQPGHHLTGTFTEGSWISCDVSPDGETVLFDFLGDLYTLPITGGRAVPLTRGMGFDAQPRFSPDGGHVLYTSDRNGGENLWIVSIDGSQKHPVTSGKSDSYLSPEWTPDGEYVAATKGSKLWMWHRSGGGGVQLIREPANMRTVGAAFGPDERFIWFSGRTTQGSLYNNGLNLYQLAIYDRNTGEVSGRSRRWGGAFRPTVSPDGRHVVYATRHIDQTGLRIREIETNEERWLAYPVQRDDQEAGASRDAYPGMSFTPDSRELVASYGGKLWRIPVQEGPAIEIPFEVDVDLPLGPVVDFSYPVEDGDEFVAKQIRDAVPSPDGGWLAFTVMQALYVMELPDGEPALLMDRPDLVQQHPDWSPDGEWIAFAGWSDGDGGHIYRVPSVGGRPEQLTHVAALYQKPRWSPDGERVLAIRGPARAYEEALTRGALGEPQDLVWVPSAGGVTQLVAPMSGLRTPHFAGDPGRVYAYHPVEGLVSMRWDGTDRRGHVQVQGARGGGGGAQSTQTVLMAPVGDLALAQVQSDLYVVKVPYVGGETPEISVANPASASFPVRKLTDIGGQFPAWGADGRSVHWSIGNAHVIYDLDAAEAHDEELRSARAGGADDESRQEDEPLYQPLEIRVRISIPRDRPSGLLALRGARVITMRGDEVIEDGDVLVRDNRIAAVGPRGSIEIPAEADVRYVSGRTIVPGFVDTHAHLRAAYEFHRPQPWSYAANLAYGVTTTRDPQTGTTDVLTYEDMVRAGLMLGPRIYSTGPGVFSSERIRDLDHARTVLKRYADYYDTKTLKMYGAGNREQRQWIVQAARELGLMPTTEGALDLKVNLTMAQDGYSGTEHNLPGVPLFEDVVQLVARSGMATTPTMLVTYGGPWAENYFYPRENVIDDMKLRTFTPFEELQQKALRRTDGWFHDNQYPFPLIADFVDRVVEAGGRGGIGSHGQLQGLGYHWELWAMGMGPDVTPHEALRIATIVGANALGLDGDLGSIEAGKLADLVVLAGNPLADLRNTNSVRHVMKNGRLYEGDSLNEVWPRQRMAGLFYWLETPPYPAPHAGMRRSR